MNDYVWFLIFIFGIPCICFTIYKIIERICEYRENTYYERKKK